MLATRSGVDSNPRYREGFYGREFGRSLAQYSARQKAYALERICSSGIRLCFGSLRFVSFASLNADARRRRISDQNFRFKSEQPYCWPGFLPRLFSSTVPSQPPQEQWRIPSLLGVRMTDRAVTSVREFAPQWLLRSFLDSSTPVTLVSEGCSVGIAGSPRASMTTGGSMMTIQAINPATSEVLKT